MIPNDNIPPPQEEKNESYVEKKRKNVYNLKNSNVEKMVNGGQDFNVLVHITILKKSYFH